jgi:hypothetical protein
MLYVQHAGHRCFVISMKSGFVLYLPVPGDWESSKHSNTGCHLCRCFSTQLKLGNPSTAHMYQAEDGNQCALFANQQEVHVLNAQKLDASPPSISHVG